MPALIYFAANISGTLSLQRGEPHTKYHNTLMYIDTGSSSTSITDIDAKELGVDINGLDMELTGGVGGFVHLPYISNLTFLLQGENSDYCIFTLKTVFIIKSKAKEKKVTGKGKHKETSFTGDFFPLLGIDAFNELKGELYLSPSKGEGQIRYNP